MGQWRFQFFQNVPVHLGVCPDNFQMHLLAQRAGKVAHHSGVTPDRIVKRSHPAFQHRSIVAAAIVVTARPARQDKVITEAAVERRIRPGAARIARNGRIVVCGAISQYNNTTPVKGPSNYLSLLVNRASMTGMVVMDYTENFGVAAREMAGWMKAGKLKTREDIVDGLETFPETLLMLFKGENTGKLLIKVADA